MWNLSQLLVSFHYSVVPVVSLPLRVLRFSVSFIQLAASQFSFTISYTYRSRFTSQLTRPVDNRDKFQVCIKDYVTRSYLGDFFML